MTHSIFIACLLALHFCYAPATILTLLNLLAARAAAPYMYSCTPPSGDPYPHRAHPLAGNYDVHSPHNLPGRLSIAVPGTERARVSHMFSGCPPPTWSEL